MIRYSQVKDAPEHPNLSRADGRERGDTHDHEATLAHLRRRGEASPADPRDLIGWRRAIEDRRALKITDDLMALDLALGDGVLYPLTATANTTSPVGKL